VEEVKIRIMMSDKFKINLPKPPEGMSTEEYVEQGYGYPAYAHQPESNDAETGRAEPPPEPEPPEQE
jgi:hypothetical protein